MTFKCEINDVKLIQSIFDAISKIVDEVQLQTDSEGVRLNALDRGHIAFVNLVMKVSAFDEFICDEPEKINIDTNELMKVLKRSKSDDRVLMSLDEGNFIITFEGEAKRTFKIRLIDLEYDSPKPPVLLYASSVDVPFKILKDACADIKLFSNKINIKTDAEKIYFYTTGQFGDSRTEYGHDSIINEEAESVFSLERVEEMLKADKVTDTLNIELGNDMPISLHLKNLSEDILLNFLLAPRIEQEV